MKTITQFLIVAILIAFAPGAILAGTNDNPCGEKEACVKVPGVSQQCFKICCGQKNPVVTNPDDDTVTQDCTCDAGSQCHRIRGHNICLDSVQLETYKEHKGKVAAAAHRKRQKAKLADLESKAKELEAVKGDVEKTRLAHLAMLQSQFTLLSDTKGWAKEELTKAKKVLKDNQKHSNDMKLAWMKLRDDVAAFEKYLSETLTPATTRAKTILNNPDTTKGHPAVLRNSLTELQTMDLTLSTLTSALIASREMIYKAEEKDLKADLKAEKKARKKAERALKAETKLPQPNEVSVSGAIIMTNLDDQSGNPEDPTVAWVKLMYRRHFAQKSSVRPFVGGGLGSGNLPDTKGFMSFVIEGGLRFGDPNWVFFWQARTAFNVIVGFLEGSGVQPSLNAGTGPGFLIKNKGFLLLEGDYTLNQPSYYGTEWHSVGFSINVGTTF
jgi:hypothetical protein